MIFPPPPHIQRSALSEDPAVAITQIERWMDDLWKWLYNLFRAVSGTTSPMQDIEKFIYLMDTPNRYAELQGQIDILKKEMVLLRSTETEELKREIANLKKMLVLEV